MKPLNIALIDDDEDDRFLFEEAIDEISLNASFWCYENGRDFLQRLVNLTVIPDIIFLDLNMPLLTGEETLDKIKCIQKVATIPVIIFSTSLELEKANILETKGAQHYLQKPTTFKALKSHLKRCIELVCSQSTSTLKHSFIL